MLILKLVFLTQQSFSNLAFSPKNPKLNFTIYLLPYFLVWIKILFHMLLARIYAKKSPKNPTNLFVILHSVSVTKIILSLIKLTEGNPFQSYIDSLPFKLLIIFAKKYPPLQHYHALKGTLSIHCPWVCALTVRTINILTKLEPANKLKSPQNLLVGFLGDDAL